MSYVKGLGHDSEEKLGKKQSDFIGKKLREICKSRNLSLKKFSHEVAPTIGVPAKDLTRFIKTGSIKFEHSNNLSQWIIGQMIEDEKYRAETCIESVLVMLQRKTGATIESIKIELYTNSEGLICRRPKISFIAQENDSTLNKSIPFPSEI